MKEQGRQYQATVVTSKGSLTRTFKSKKKAADWVNGQKGLITYVIDVVK